MKIGPEPLVQYHLEVLLEDQDDDQDNGPTIEDEEDGTILEEKYNGGTAMGSSTTRAQP